MTLFDATLALFLTLRIHGTDAAIRATAKRCAKQLPRSQRELMYKIVDSKTPKVFVAYVAQSLEERSAAERH